MSQFRDDLIIANLGLARYHAARMAAKLSGPTTSYEDLFQAACIGLCKAADTWIESESPFAAWATIKIRAEIGEELKRTYRRIRPPRKAQHCTWEPLRDEGDQLWETDPDSFEIHDQVAGLLVYLKSKTREIVSLYYGLLDGREWTCQQIAVRVGCSHTNIENHVREALRILHEHKRI